MSILIYKQRHRHPNYKKTPKGNYAHIGYIATRPGAVKNEGMRHGLFGKLESGAVKEFDTWQEAARLVRELSYRRVNMYRGIISFSPETAAELGLSDHKAWEDYIDRHILTLAKFNGIRVQDLQWVAAHHNEKGPFLSVSDAGHHLYDVRFGSQRLCGMHRFYPRTCRQNKRQCRKLLR